MLYGAGVGVAEGAGVSVGWGEEVGEEAVVGLGVAVALGLGAAVAFGDDPEVGVSAGEIAGIGVGLIKMILMAPSSGTGESTFLPVTTTPIVAAIRITNPRSTVMAASVRRRSSILP